MANNMYKMIATLHKYIGDETVIFNKNAQQLLTSINSLLDFRKLDVGAETAHYKSGDIVNFIREICSTFQEYALDHTISFCFMCEVENLNMSFDPVKIKKVMNNLLCIFIDCI